MALSKYNVTCVFEDGATTSFQASPLETVYQAALRGGVTLETDCREGACATCKAFRSDGEADIGDVSDEALTPEEEDEGFVLCCQARARSDLVLEFPYPLSLINKTVQTVDGVVEAVEDVADNVMRLAVRAESAPAFLPGQYMNIAIPGTDTKRSYSFANSPDEPAAMEFFVRILPGGAMSEYLRGTKAGDPIQLEGPYGQFFLRPPRGNHVLMVAGGTGLAPMLSILARLETLPQRPKVTLLYGANHDGELFALERLRGYDWVDLRTIVVEGSEAWDGPTGFVTELIDDGLLAEPAGVDAYLCGPPPMIDAAREALAKRGVEAKRIFAEKFLPAAS